VTEGRKGSARIEWAPVRHNADLMPKHERNSLFIALAGGRLHSLPVGTLLSLSDAGLAS
jgi:hypothetical protein